MSLASLGSSSHGDIALEETTEENPVVKANQQLLLLLPSKNVKVVTVTPKTTISLGKFGSFKSDDIIGSPYGLTYEIHENKTIVPIAPSSIDEIEDDVGNNRELNDDATAQTLTWQEIEALKMDKSIQGKEIVEAVMAAHSNFDKKTEFAKEKYQRRKEQKFLRGFTVLAPTLPTICDYLWTRDQHRILDIRTASLSYILAQANIFPGGRYLVVDDTGGLVVAAMLERMAGEGTLMVLHENEHPALDVCRYFNFSPRQLAPVKSLSWLQALHPEETDPRPEMPAPEAIVDGKGHNAAKRLAGRLKSWERVDAAQRDFLEGGWDGCVVVSTFDPVTIVAPLLPYLEGSRPLVVYAPHKETLLHLSLHLHNGTKRHVLAPTIVSLRAREYQTLPGRVHPMMTMGGGGGWVLSGMRVLPSEVEAVAGGMRQAGRGGKKKAKRVNEEGELLQEESLAKKMKVGGEGGGTETVTTGTGTPMDVDTSAAVTEAEAEAEA
ncbi:tRNA (adenine(58)-N(1))-methyltransferase non-catalytic subunit trm6 [Saitoella coloradoensis]